MFAGADADVSDWAADFENELLGVLLDNFEDNSICQ